MNKKDVNFLKKAAGKPEETAIVKVASCYVNPNENEMNVQGVRRVDAMDESLSDQLLTYVRKAVTGKPGVNALEFEPETNPLEKLRKTGLEDEEALREVFETMRDEYDGDGEAFCVYAALGRADAYGADEAAYEFVLLVALPCVLSKPGLIYDRPQNELMGKPKNRDLQNPTLAFLHPSIDGGYADWSKTACFMKSAKDKQARSQTAEALFGVPLPISAAEQKEALERMMTGDKARRADYGAMKEVISEIAQRREDGKIAGENVTFTAAELASIVSKATGADADEDEEIRKIAEGFEGYSFAAENLAPDRVAIELGAGDFTVKSSSKGLGEIQKRTIDGVEYYLVPAAEAVLEGINVK